MKYLVAATGLAIAIASPALAADRLSGAWTTGGPAAQTFVFKASGDRFGGIACGPCDKASSIFRVEDGRILDGDHISFFVSYDTSGPRFKEFGKYRDRLAGAFVDGQLSLSAQPEGRNAPPSTIKLMRVVEGFIPDTTNVGPSSLLTTDPPADPSPIDGRWVSVGRTAQQNFTLKVRGQKIWGVVCGPCNPEVVTLIDDGTFDGKTVRFYINHIDTPPSPQRKGVQRNIMTGTLSDNNVMKFKWVREGAETEPGGEIVMIGPIRE
jgi:hypothetical protein